MSAPTTLVSSNPTARWLLPALALTAVLALAILYLTLGPDSGRPPRVPHLDKLYHFAAFAALTLPLSVVLPSLRAALALAVLALALGGAIELIQPRFGRGAEGLDMVANAAGILTAAALGRWLHAYARRRAGA